MGPPPPLTEGKEKNVQKVLLESLRSLPLVLFENVHCVQLIGI
jgi:hypothetical protein